MQLKFYMLKNICMPLFVYILFCGFAATPLHSQEANEKNNFSMYLGLGKVYYFNNMEIQLPNQSYVEQNSWGCSIKFMWESEHRLSVGLETGFYRLYTFYYNDKNNIYNELGSITTDYFPFFLNVNMRVIDNLSLGIGTGIVSLANFSVSDDWNYTLSLANYHALANYIFPIGKNKKWQLGAEVRYLWIGKTNDHDLTYQALFGYRF